MRLSTSTCTMRYMSPDPACVLPSSQERGRMSPKISASKSASTWQASCAFSGVRNAPRRFDGSRPCRRHTARCGQ